MTFMFLSCSFLACFPFVCTTLTIYVLVYFLIGVVNTVITFYMEYFYWFTIMQ